MPSARSAAYGAFLFLNTLYLQDARGLSALQAGLYTLPLAVCAMVMAPISGRLVARIGTRRPLLIAGVALGIGPLLLTSLTPHTSIWLLFASYVIFGMGLGLVNPPITNTAISGMPPAQAGVAGAIASSSRQVGSTIGIALVGRDRRRQLGRQVRPAVRAGHPRRLVVDGRLRSDTVPRRRVHDNTGGVRERTRHSSSTAG